MSEDLQKHIDALVEFKPTTRKMAVTRTDYRLNKKYQTFVNISNSFYKEQKPVMLNLIEELINIQKSNPDFQSFPKYLKNRIILSQLLKIIDEHQIKTLFKKKMMQSLINSKL